MQRHLSLLIILAALEAGTGNGADHRPAPSILDFSLGEREGDIVKKLGPSEHLSAGTGYRTLDYLLGPEERSDEDYDWTFYFERPSGALVSVTRNFAKPASVAALLKGDGVRSHTYDAGPHASLEALSLTLPGDRVLVAVGLSKTNDACSQLVLMRRAALPRFYPWIAKDLP
mgnify:CR=1 FL=1